MIRVAIVEDEAACRLQLEEHLRRFGRERGEELEIALFPDGLALADGYRPIWDILLLDIETPRMDGMAAARRVRALDQDVIILFVTNMAKYAIKGYEVDALDFLVKPVGYFTLSLKLDKALRHVRSRARRVLMIQEGDEFYRVPVGEICYIEVRKHRLYFHTTGGLRSMPGSLSDMEERLAGEHFVRCNKGYLVNLRHVSLVKGDTVVVAGEELIVSRRRREEFLLAVTDYYGGGGR